jgi:hypothetical protein
MAPQSFGSGDPSPLLLTALYMAGILGGYVLLTAPEEWQRAWQTVRQAWTRRRQG